MGIIIKILGKVYVDRKTFQIIPAKKAKELIARQAEQKLKAEQSLEKIRLELDELNKARTGDVEAQLKRMDELEQAGKYYAGLLDKLKIPPFEERRAWGILLYSDYAYFNYFYNKHVMHKMPPKREDEPYSVLVVDDVGIMSQEDARKVVEEAIRAMTYREKVFNQDVATPQVVPSHKLNVRLWGWVDSKFVSEPIQGVICLRDIKKIRSPDDLKIELEENKVSSADLNRLQQLIDGALKPGAEYAIQYILFIDKYFARYYNMR